MGDSVDELMMAFLEKVILREVPYQYDGVVKSNPAYAGVCTAKSEYDSRFISTWLFNVFIPIALPFSRSLFRPCSQNIGVMDTAVASFSSLSLEVLFMIIKHVEVLEPVLLPGLRLMSRYMSSAATPMFYRELRLDNEMIQIFQRSMSTSSFATAYLKHCCLYPRPHYINPLGLGAGDGIVDISEASQHYKARTAQCMPFDELRNVKQMVVLPFQDQRDIMPVFPI